MSLITTGAQRMSRLLRNGVARARHLRESAQLSAGFAAAAEALPGAAAYAHLQVTSLALCGLQFGASAPRRLNIVLPELSTQAIFAGVRTALEFACELARGLELPLRVVTLRGRSSAPQRQEIADYLAREFGLAGAVVQEARELPGLVLNRADLWVATHWTTAHALDVACRLQVLKPASVLYLVQDYEPGFHAWSSDFALARATYHAGFRLVVNSTPLQRYLQQFEGIAVDPARVFAPSVDLKRLEAAARERSPATALQVFFYARPSKPRNLYTIGLSALHLVAGELARRGIEARFISAGEAHGDVQLSPRHWLRSQGKLPWNDYFRVIAESDVVLSLQHSPHPSHPPLDALTAGGIAVTNELGGTRAGLHPRLLVAEPEPSALAAQLLRGVERAQAGGPAAFDASFVAGFGGSVGEVVASLARALRDEEATAPQPAVEVSL